MASRRMFAKSITDSARFLRMPATSRLLYYDLGMQADDDGIVEAFTVIRTTGASEDDLKVLMSKGFVSILNDDLVTYINDWEINNSIRKDRYQPSFYRNLLVQLKDAPELATICQPDDNQTATTCQPSDNQVSPICQTDNAKMATTCQPSDNQMTTQDRIGKDSIGEDSTGEERIVQNSQEQDSTAGGKRRFGGENPPYHEKNAPLDAAEAKKVKQWKQRVRWYADHYTYSLTEEEKEYIVCEFMECNLLNQIGLDLLGKHAGNKTALFETIERLKERCKHDLA